VRRSLTYTKLATDDSLRLAIDDYEKLLQMVDSQSVDGRSLATWLSNEAEIQMMLGDLDDAIATYTRALDSQDRALYGYGLAVALDRDGQGVKAREVMRSYAAIDQLRDLTEPEVFFVPAGEIHYYLALGHESLGHVAKAIAHYQKFIASGAHPQFAPRARANIRALRHRRGHGGAGSDRAGGPETWP
jgi:tetratricopeptide (TPR) repeat protein